jgi:hypothetical protein
MRYVISGLLVAFMIFMLIGGLSGRIRAESCCNIADSSRDSRMRGADSEMVD